MTMLLKNSFVEVKQLSEKGEGVAVIATLNEIDKDGDVTTPGAFGEQTVPMVPAHEWHSAPIGKATISEKDNEALAHFRMNLKTDLGRNWHEALKFDLANPPAKQEYSYGFSIQENGAEMGDFSGRPVRFLKSLKVHEISPVLLGAGIATRTLALKSAQSEDEKGRRLTNLLNTLVDEEAERRKRTRSEMIAEIAERAGVKPDAIRRTLRGDTNVPSEGQLQAFSSVLSVSARRLETAMGTSGTRSSDDDVRWKTATPVHHTDTNPRVWDAALNERRVRSEEEPSYYNRIYAWRDPEGDPGAKSSWRFIHHFVDASGEPGAASTRAGSLGIGVLNGARGGTTIPDADRRGVWNHLAAHQEDAELTPPALRSWEDMSVKLVDQIKFIGWDIEAVVERLNEIKEMRGKDGRGISETSLSGVRELQDLVLKLDAAIKRPTITTQQHEVVERFRSLQQRLIDDNGF
jgi:transcriptional regulator with XRE-family HTH domain